MQTCYRHPSRETGVSCSNCGRPICPDCMTPTPVGMRCPECAKQKTQVRNVRAQYDAQPRVTIALIAINALIFVGMSTQSGLGSAGGRIFSDYSLYGPLVGSEPWRLITSGFLHSGIIHIGFNMYVLWFMGNLLEPSLGPVRFAGLYLAALLTGSFAVLLINPDTPTIGASGAIFGLMGAAFVMQRARGIDPMQSGIGPIIAINLALGFIIPNVSVAGHVGGLIGGALCGFLMDQSMRYRRRELPVVICVVVGAAAVAGSLAIA